MPTQVTIFLSETDIRLERFGEKDLFFVKERYCRHCSRNEWTLSISFHILRKNCSICRAFMKFFTGASLSLMQAGTASHRRVRSLLYINLSDCFMWKTRRIRNWGDKARRKCNGVYGGKPSSIIFIPGAMTELAQI